MVQTDHQREALKWLGCLQRGTPLYRECIRWLRKEVEAGRGSFTFEDIGTSEAMLEQFRLEGCKSNAKMWLGHLRAGPDAHRFTFPFEDLRGLIKKEIGESDLTCEDIGSDPDELRRLLLVA